MFNCTGFDYCRCDTMCYLSIASFIAFCGTVSYLFCNSYIYKRRYYVLEPKIEDSSDIPPDYESSQVQSPPSYG